MEGCKAEHVTARVVVDVAEQLFANADHEMVQHGCIWKLMSPGIIRRGNLTAKRVIYWSSQGHDDWPLCDLCWADATTGPDGNIHKRHNDLNGTMSSQHVSQIGDDNGLNPRLNRQDARVVLVTKEGVVYFSHNQL